jgi:putative ABC transport system ATP-binding protein
MTESIVHLQDLRFRWPEQECDLLHIPELVVKRSEHLFIQGPSGSGKTTLLNLLTGINLPNSGSVSVLGTPLERLSNSRRDQFRADHLGVIFQQFNLLPYLSLLENVQLPCGFSPRKKTNAGDIEATALRLLAHLNIADSLLNQPVSK